jgi:hypothetical protein
MQKALSRYFSSETVFRMLSWLLFCVFTFPLLTASSFTTLDGPGHIHNAKIIGALLMGSDSLWSHYFELNSFISPNLLGHYLLLIVVECAGEAYADRVMLVLCMASLFFSIGYLLRALRVDGAFLLLPLCFLLNTPLFSGFFSFTLGLAAMFLTTGYFLRMRELIGDHPMPLLKSIALALLLLLTYLLHLVPAVLACMFIAIAFMTAVFQKRHEHGWKIGMLRKPMITVALAVLPVSCLIILYQLHDAETGQYSYIASTELARQWGVMQGLIINHRDEWAFTRWYWIVPISALIIDFMLLKLKPYAFRKVEHSINALPMIIIMLTALCGLYFVMPDASSGGGALSVRLNFLLVVFSLIVLFMLIQTSLMRIIAITALLMVLFDHRNKILDYHEEHAFFMRDVKELNSAIDQPGVLLVHRFRYDWPFEHCTKYLGSKQEIVQVDALGGHKIYAPVMWKPALRNRPELVAMFDKGWLQDPLAWLGYFQGERVYVLAIGNPSPTDSTAWSNWQAYMQSKSAAESWSSDSLMHLYAFVP